MRDKKQTEYRIRRIDKVCRLLEPDERAVSTCFFCGRKGKAAYKIDATDTAISPVSFKASCCRNCMKVIPRKTIV